MACGKSAMKKHLFSNLGRQDRAIEVNHETSLRSILISLRSRIIFLCKFPQNCTHTFRFSISQ
eukprot:m.400991 g.400991  ORF g.400991 m.400991 type:complete len:63 (+) comp16785_c1_seq10:7189-7377(+)